MCNRQYSGQRLECCDGDNLCNPRILSVRRLGTIRGTNMTCYFLWLLTCVYTSPQIKSNDEPGIGQKIS